METIRQLPNTEAAKWKRIDFLDYNSPVCLKGGKDRRSTSTTIWSCCAPYRSFVSLDLLLLNVEREKNDRVAGRVCKIMMHRKINQKSRQLFQGIRLYNWIWRFPAYWVSLPLVEVADAAFCPSRNRSKIVAVPELDWAEEAFTKNY